MYVGLAPIVILHGIGLGLAPYTAFIKRIQAEHPERTIIAVQYKHVSMRLTSHIPTATEVADDVAMFLREQVSIWALIPDLTDLSL